MDTLIAVGIWVLIFAIWYGRTYPEKFKHLSFFRTISFHRHGSARPARSTPTPPAAAGKHYKQLVALIESISEKRRMQASDAATMVEAVKELMQIEPASAQIWEAFVLDSLETSDISCDDCRVAVAKTVKRTGVKIQCPQCHKWLALKNSKVTVIDARRGEMEDWER
jgi:hypothetical protein